jgi:hypothetical protein
MGFESLTNRAHEWVKDADSEGCTAGEWLSHIKLRVGVIIVILVEELDVSVVTYNNMSSSNITPKIDLFQ